jgi:integrase
MGRTPAGIRARHSRKCGSRGEGKCNCTPTYEAWVWSNRDDKKIYRSFPNQAEAKSWRSDASGAVRRGALLAPTKNTLREVAEEWLDKAERGEVLNRFDRPYKPSALRGYRHDLETYVLPLLGARRFSEIRRQDVRNLIEELIGRNLSASKVHNVIVPLQAIYRRAIHSDEVALDPTDKVQLPRVSGRRERVATPDQAAALLAAVPDDDRALWATAFYAGLRRGELRAVRWSDIDEAVSVIHVQRGWDDSAGEIAPKSEKGARKVPIATALRLFLLEHKARTGRRDNDLVFGRTRTEPFTPTHVRNRALGAWAATAVGAFFAGRSADLDPIKLHECRHTYVSLMHEAGLSLERIGDYVGHSSSYMTDRYRHLLEGHEQDAADRFDAYLTRSTGARSGAQIA